MKAFAKSNLITLDLSECCQLPEAEMAEIFKATNYTNILIQFSRREFKEKQELNTKNLNQLILFLKGYHKEIKLDANDFHLIYNNFKDITTNFDFNPFKMLHEITSENKNFITNILHHKPDLKIYSNQDITSLFMQLTRCKNGHFFVIKGIVKDKENVFNGSCFELLSRDLICEITKFLSLKCKNNEIQLLSDEYCAASEPFLKTDIYEPESLGSTIENE